MVASLQDRERSAVHLTLEQTDDDRGFSVRRVLFADDGGLTIEGHDLGVGVERFFGEGNTEYEFTRTVTAAGVGRLREVLDLDPEADLGDELRRRFAHPGGSAELERTLKDHGIETTFWSRVGE
ncbi:hypothetical protein [Microlunatus sp. GCM10028923]|uniref:hypothetical protein n=1 Tax=Microlunatus sp. GCM10028923 TaxID=3273400 RepID=UPI0036221A42